MQKILLILSFIFLSLGVHAQSKSQMEKQAAQRYLEMKKQEEVLKLQKIEAEKAKKAAFEADQESKEVLTEEPLVPKVEESQEVLSEKALRNKQEEDKEAAERERAYQEYLKSQGK